ncbi:FAD-binding oxidoreductase [Tropicimonas sp. IMCC6043]|uniref:NAD(P)/FAD-dependent oxidoreductase n=1 Tax=Tropicimonas sp. IMCC6043 TaxID=2510645 RepID=UPI00101DC901|nr:FAD-binding oxidoreductase [Tropicimonas sp. IMCC6043]RYH09321.1 FAD-binding oxidoreductase [Tropicimonas sp. IMCC6043]
MSRIYEPFGYGEGPVARSYWPSTVSERHAWPRLDGAMRADIAIVGGGYTGLSAALHLAEAGADVALIDANAPGWGASGRNGGFCCLGGTALDADGLARRYGAEDTQCFFDAERAAIDLVADLLDRLGIEADTGSRGETMLAHRAEAIPQLEATARHMRHVHGVTCEILSRAELAAAGMASGAFHGAVTTPVGFSLNPLKYALGLAQAAADVGARVFAASPAETIRRSGDVWKIATPAGELTARRLILATNGYSSDDLPGLAARYLPLQSNILVTRPLTTAEIAAQGWTTGQMCYDSRTLLHYFRLLPDRRMLFGMRGAIRATPEALAAIGARARADFDRLFPAWATVETTHLWSGFVALARNRTPFVGPLPGVEAAFAGLCYHGNGVAMGSYAGALLARLALGRPPELPYPKLMAKPLARFPFGRHRRTLLRAILPLHAMMDGA